MGLNLEQSRIAILYKQGFIAQIFGIINVGICIFVLQADVSGNALAIWGAAGLSIWLFRFIFQKYFQLNYLNKNKNFNPKIWENAFVFGTFIMGSHWGVVAVFLLPKDAVTLQAFMGFILAGTSAGAAVAYCTSMRSIIAFVVPAAVPLGIHLSLGESNMQYSMAALLFLYLTLTLALMYGVHKYVLEVFKLRFEKDALIEDLKQAKAKAVHAEKMSSLGEMASGIAHEINNPLTIIKLNLSTIADLAKSGKTSMIAEIAKKTDTTISRITKIISGLRSFSRDDSHGQAEITQVSEIISETLDFCQTRFKSRGIDLKIDTIPLDYLVSCRKTQIQQVVLNLLNNACDAVEGTESAWVRVETYEEGDHLIIAVSDSGHGIPEEIQNKIMEPFFTTKGVGKGTGLGLSISHGIVRSHEGTLSLDTASPNTRFVIKLPAIRREAMQIASGL